MAEFGPAYLIVADSEGGYQDHSSDSGNYNSLGELVGTNWGISAPVYEEWIGYPPSRGDMLSMPKSTARLIYRTNFWNDIQGDSIVDQGVANILFDGRVNHGRTGVRIMQRILGVPVDGHVGPITLGAINSSDPRWLVGRYKNARREFYHELVENNPSYSVFLNGWLNRLSEFEGGSTGGAIGVVVAAFVAWMIMR